MSSLADSLTSYFSTFLIPNQMLTHGLVLLQRVFDINSSTSDVLQLVPAGTYHTLTPPYSCTNMVYFLAKRGTSVAGPQQAISIVLSNTLAYVGQTENFTAREQSRTGSMRESNTKICMGHGLTHYQMDALEVVSIAFILLKYGSRCRNMSPYPRYVYRDIPPSMSVYDTVTQDSLLQQNTYGLLRRMMIVGNAPPQTGFDREGYQESLLTDANPLLDWSQESQRSRNIRRLMDILTMDNPDLVGELPPFINHYPGMNSKKIDAL